MKELLLINSLETATQAVRFLANATNKVQVLHLEADKEEKYIQPFGWLHIKLKNDFEAFDLGSLYTNNFPLHLKPETA